MAPIADRTLAAPAGRSVELRVHGVGGDSPEKVLGLPYAEGAVPVWTTKGGRHAVLARASDDTVRVFSWGQLTSASRWLALWTLLLPFTLVNVAAWMHPPGDSMRVRATRWLVYAVGLLLTVMDLTLMTSGSSTTGRPTGVGGGRTW